MTQASEEPPTEGQRYYCARSRAQDSRPRLQPTECRENYCTGGGRKYRSGSDPPNGTAIGESAVSRFAKSAATANATVATDSHNKGGGAFGSFRTVSVPSTNDWVVAS